MIDLNEMWKKNPVMPVVTVDAFSGKVLMLGYMNKDAFAYTLKTGKVWYSNKEGTGIRMKGKHGGNVQKLVSIKADYDCDSLLMTVEQTGHVCHHDGGHSTYFIHNIYGNNDESSKHKKFGRVEVDEDFDYSKEDYDDFYEDE